MSDQISTLSGTYATLAPHTELAQRVALEVPVLRAGRRALPVRRPARVGERAGRVPRDRPVLARLRKPGTVDPEVGVRHRVRRVRGGRDAEAAQARVAPDVDPPAVRKPVVDRP